MALISLTRQALGSMVSGTNGHGSGCTMLLFHPISIQRQFVQFSCDVFRNMEVKSFIINIVQLSGFI